MRSRLALGHAQRLHLLHEVGLLASGVSQRHQFDVDVGLTLRRVVQVQHPLAVAALTRTRHGAAFASLVTGHAEVVRHLIAGSAHHGSLRAELTAV